MAPSFYSFVVYSLLLMQYPWIVGRSQNLASRRKLPLLSEGIHWSTVYDPPNATISPSGYAAAVAAYNEVVSNGLSAYQLGLTWDAFETDTPGIICTDCLQIYLQILQQSNLVPIVGLSFINTVALSIPNDLKDQSDPTKLANGMDFMSETFRTRYYALLDVMVPLVVQYGGFYVVFANEFDGYIPAQSTQYQHSFTQFILNASDYVHDVLGYDQLATGVTVMHGGLTSLAGTAWFDTLLNGLDIMSVTYYPLQSDFVVKHPSHIIGDIQLIADTLPNDMSIVLQEFGYPSGYLNGATNNSTQDKQAAFYNQCNIAFTPLIERNRLKIVSAFKLIDWSDTQCSDFEVYYGINNAQFKEYLCTLGMITYDGVEKNAYQTYLTMIQQTYTYVGTSDVPTMAPSLTLTPSQSLNLSVTTMEPTTEKSTGNLNCFVFSMIVTLYSVICT